MHNFISGLHVAFSWCTKIYALSLCSWSSCTALYWEYSAVGVNGECSIRGCFRSLWSGETSCSSELKCKFLC